MYEIFETHAHYDDERFDKDREKLLASLPTQGVTRIVNVACSIDTIKASAKLAEAFPFVYATVGVHPHEASTMSEDVLERMAEACSHPKVVAVGEIGLDFHYDHSPRDVQREWFIKQLELAARVNLPVVIHSREASQEVFDILKTFTLKAQPNGGAASARRIITASGALNARNHMIEQRGTSARGIIHSYSGSAEMALDYVKMGFYIGIGGVVTFDKTRKLPEVVAAVPLERLVVETDSPYLTPAPNRGKRNDSSNLKFIIEKIAEIKRITPEEVARVTYENAMKVYRIQ